MSERGIADDLAELVADTRALLEDARTRGAWGEPRVERAPPAVDEPVAAVTAATAPPQAPGWSELATRSRSAGPPAAGALQAVRDALGDCRRCPLHKGRRTIVFGVGSPDADLVVIGEAPGYHEDQQGEPFVGPAGQMLDKMLENVLGVARADAYILNVVKCRPPKNRNPLPAEVDACRPFLEGQVRAIAPRVGLVLGSVAFRAVFQTDDGITRSRGAWRDFMGTPMMPTFHPAYLLRKPQDKRLTFADLKEVRRRLDALRT